MARLLWDPFSTKLRLPTASWDLAVRQSNVGITFEASVPEASGELRLNLGGDRLGYLFVVIELHGEGGTPLRHGAQIAHIAEHVGERHHRVDDVGVAAHVLALDLPAARVEVADDRTGIVFGRHHLDLHDRLEQDRRALLQRLTQRRARADFEGERRRIDVMIGTVDQRHLEIDHREPRQDARSQDRFEALFDAGNVFLRYRSTDDFVLELEASSRRQRFGDDFDASKLARPAGLLLVGIIDGDPLGDLLAIGDLRRADIGVDPVAALEDVDLDLEMKLAHAFEDGLPRFLVGRNAE